MTHSEGTNSVKRCFGVWLERNGFALTDLLDGNQRHPGEHFGILQLRAQLFKRPNFGKDQSLLGRSRLQVICTPLQNGILERFEAVRATEKVECTLMQLRIEVQCDDMPAITCFTEERKLKEGTIVEETHCGRAPINGLPDPLEEAGEAPKGFAHVD